MRLEKLSGQDLTVGEMAGPDVIVGEMAGPEMILAEMVEQELAALRMVRVCQIGSEWVVALRRNTDLEADALLYVRRTWVQRQCVLVYHTVPRRMDFLFFFSHRTPHQGRSPLDVNTFSSLHVSCTPVPNPTYPEDPAASAIHFAALVPVLETS